MHGVIMEQDYLTAVRHTALTPSAARQWALIHVEQQWADNERTVDGSLMHRRAHDETLLERRGDTLTARGSAGGFTPPAGHRRVRRGGVSPEPQRRDASGSGGGLWLPCPVEYKRGAPKAARRGRACELCAQAMCLEEMLLLRHPGGLRFTTAKPGGESRSPFTSELRGRVTEILSSHARTVCAEGTRPSPRPAGRCRACSLKEVCLPGLKKSPPVDEYLRAAAEEAEAMRTAAQHAVCHLGGRVSGAGKRKRRDLSRRGQGGAVPASGAGEHPELFLQGRKPRR